MIKILVFAALLTAVPVLSLSTVTTQITIQPSTQTKKIFYNSAPNIQMTGVAGTTWSGKSTTVKPASNWYNLTSSDAMSSTRWVWAPAFAPLVGTYAFTMNLSLQVLPCVPSRVGILLLADEDAVVTLGSSSPESISSAWSMPSDVNITDSMLKGGNNNQVLNITVTNEAGPGGLAFQIYYVC